MKNLILIGVIGFFVYGSGSFGAREFRCLGSDGGTPFSNIPNDGLNKKLLQSKGTIKDFVFHEELDQIVYRNQTNQIRVMNLTEGTDRFVAHSQSKISKVVENDLGRILLAGSTYYLDTEKSGAWFQYGYPNRVLSHLFSKQGDIFSLEALWQDRPGLLQNGKYHISFITHEAHKTYRRQCSIPAGVGENLKLATGNIFPYVYFTAHKKWLLEDKVMVYRMAVNQIWGKKNCPIEEMTQYPYENVGDVKAFYYFNIQGTDGYAFHLNDPRRQLFWDKPGECAYFNLNGKSPVFISPKAPLIASWKNGDGLSLYNLHDKTELRFFKELNQPLLGTEHLWLDEGGERLFTSLATSKNEPNSRLIVVTDLNK